MVALMRIDPGERPAALKNIPRVSPPKSDPVRVSQGPLLRLWSDGSP